MMRRRRKKNILKRESISEVLCLLTLVTGTFIELVQEQETGRSKRIYVSLAPSYLRTSYIPANKALSANHLTSTSPSEVSFCSAGATWDEINPADSGSLFRMGVRASNDFATLNRTLGMESSFNSRTTGRTFSLTISVGRTFATV